jgi:hypothetical protein
MPQKLFVRMSIPFILSAVAAPVLIGAVQLEVSPVDSSITGIGLIGPADPAFGSAISRIIPVAVLPIASPYLPYSVVITNRSGQPLLAITVRFVVTDTTGHVRQFVHMLNREVLSEPVLSTGGETVLALQRTSLEAALAGNAVASQSPTENAKSVYASLDLAIYADGTVAGPDAGISYARATSQLQASLDVCAGVQKSEANGSGAVAFLTTLASANVAPPKPFSPDVYAYFSYSRARSFLTLAQTGRAAQVTALCGQMTGSIPLLLAALHR